MAEVADPDDLGLVLAGDTDLGVHLTRIGTIYGQMGEPTGSLEERLARIDRGDLWWALQELDRVRAAHAEASPAT